MKENNLSKLLDVLIYILVVLILVTLYHKNTDEQNTEPTPLKGDAYHRKESELFKTKVLSNGKVGTEVMNNTYITPEGSLHYGF